MAAFITRSKGFVRLSGHQICSHGLSRGFRTSSKTLAAQNFTMPALSPTMTEGNIASWKVKEGDSFSAGDVLLEVETDKAQMDVEAQDDGVMAKITQGDGSKAIKVGTRIAVIAEADDDLSSLSLPPEDSASAPSPQEDTKSGVDASKTSESQAEAPPSSKAADTPPAIPASSVSDPDTASKPSSSGKSSKQTYPLYPSVSQLLHEHKIPTSEADKIPASGPKGRLLKGDVLAYLGSIKSSYSSDQSARIAKLGRLDLSNVKIAPPKQTASPPSPSGAVPPSSAPEPDTEIAVSISLKAVLEVQKRIQSTLGITLPLSTFVARATEVANDDLPRSKFSKPSADELFDQVLGLDKVGVKTSRGSFTPQITALPSAPMPMGARLALKQPDIIDILTGTKPASGLGKQSSIIASASTGPLSTTNVFSVNVPKGEEKRARVFLERVKTILQVEPGSLVL
ncbi:Single hybrid motif [Lasallia pustulata]|uniref:Single hybrid motif n=1 Tax=Lasallia pustulata TaxID=136370 RepID=A0A1W5CUL1_9LECA|nr:Single hybrid motif [Lasallia pustulata]